jgi:hypothetical protein
MVTGTKRAIETAMMTWATKRVMAKGKGKGGKCNIYGNDEGNVNGGKIDGISAKGGKG